MNEMKEMDTFDGTISEDLQVQNKVKLRRSICSWRLKKFIMHNEFTNYSADTQAQLLPDGTLEQLLTAGLGKEELEMTADAQLEKDTLIQKNE